MPMELFEIPGFPDFKITRTGKVWSITNKKWLKVRLWVGYLCVNLCNKVGYTQRHLHRLLLETFVEPCPPGMECRHLDGDPLNNNLENLKWGTHYENVQDTVLHNTFTRGEKNGKLVNNQVVEIRRLWSTGVANQIMLAKQFGVSNAAIHNLVKYKTYREVK